jgi:hypothetical protein
MFTVSHVWVLIISGFVPLLVSAAARPEDSGKTRAALAAAASVALAVVKQVVDRDGIGIPFEALAGTAASAFVTAALAYEHVWKHAKVNDRVLPGFAVTGKPKTVEGETGN